LLKKKNKMKNISISPYTILGATGGVAIGHYIFKANSLLTLMILGVVGGVLANKMDKTIQDRILNKAKDLQTKVVSQTDGILSGDSKAKSSFEGDSNITGEEVYFDPRVGYLFPHGTIKSDNVQEYYDIDLN